MGALAIAAARVLAASGALAAASCNEPAAPSAHAARPASSAATRTPMSSANPSFGAQRPGDGGAGSVAADFRLEVTGPASPGTGPSRVVVESRRVTVVRAQAPVEGTAVGVFRAGASDDEIARLAASVPLPGELGPVAPGMPSALVSVRAAGQTSEIRIPLPSASPKASALMDEIGKLEQRALAAPAGALRLEVSPPAGPVAARRAAPVRVALVHAGSAPIEVSLPAGGPRLEATERRPPPAPNETPLPAVWERVSPDAPAQTAITLAVGGRHELELPATFRDAGAFDLWARLEGPIALSLPGEPPLTFHALALAKPVPIVVAPR